MKADAADWLNQAKSKLKRGSKLLFAKDSALLADLNDIISRTNHKAMILWAFEFASATIGSLGERYPTESRPKVALEVTRAWAAGEVKMPIAKRAILECHALAKELNSPVDIALCHAVGQACGVVHVKEHAIGFLLYELTAIALRCGVDNCKGPVEQRVAEYLERVAYWQEHCADQGGEWADFLER